MAHTSLHAVAPTCPSLPCSTHSPRGTQVISITRPLPFLVLELDAAWLPPSDVGPSSVATFLKRSSLPNLPHLFCLAQLLTATYLPALTMAWDFLTSLGVVSAARM